MHNRFTPLKTAFTGGAEKTGAGLSSPRASAYTPATYWKFFHHIDRDIKQKRKSVYIIAPPVTDPQGLGRGVTPYLNDTETSAFHLSGFEAPDFKKLADALANAIGLESENPYEGLGGFMRDCFKKSRMIVPVINHAEKLTDTDRKYLYEMADIIYERYPKQKTRPLFRFVFIGEAAGVTDFKRKDRSLSVFDAPLYERRDVINHLCLSFPHLSQDKALETGADRIIFETAGAVGAVREIFEDLQETRTDISAEKVERLIDAALFRTLTQEKRTEIQDICESRFIAERKMARKRRLMMLMSVIFTFLAVVGGLFILKKYF